MSAEEIADFEPNAHIQGAFDAVTLLAQASRRVWDCIEAESTGRPRPSTCADIDAVAGAMPGQTFSSDRDLPLRKIYAALRTTTGGQAYQGVSGCVDFGAWEGANPGDGADPLTKFVAVQRIQAQGEALIVTDAFSDGKLVC